MTMADEEAQARADVWKYAFGYITTRVMKTAVELEISELLEKRGGAPISLSDLSSAVGCRPDAIRRIMRFLIHHGMFKKIKGPHEDDDVYYGQSPLSRLLMKNNLGPFLLLQGTPPGPNAGITPDALRTGNRPDLVAVGNGDDKLWSNSNYHGRSMFTAAMAAHAAVTMSAFFENYKEGFQGVGSVVDVGGRHGLAAGMVVKAFPLVKGICFDLPDVVAMAPPIDGVQFVGGSMFESVPKADAVMLVWVLHDWSDEECIEILKKCKEAIPADSGKVIIVDAVVDQDDEGDEYKFARLALDMIMMATTVKGKERTYTEWEYVLNAAGFSRHTLKNIKTIESVIEAFP